MARQVADACRGEAVITMLADDEAIEDVVFSDEGLLRSLPRRGVHISMSTISVELSERLSERLAEMHARAGQRFVWAPVFGRPDIAAAETLHAPMPLASLLHDRLMTLIARGGEQLDWSALGQLAAATRLNVITGGQT